MKLIQLGDGSVVFSVSVDVFIARYDFLAAASLLLKKGKKIKSREHLIRVVKMIVQNHGTQAFVRLMDRYAKEYALPAHLIVTDLFPELRMSERERLLFSSPN